MKKNKFTEKNKTLVIYIAVTAVLVILAALLGYHLTILPSVICPRDSMIYRMTLQTAYQNLRKVLI